uniref:(northern house mosquito) hypothetical protein n=1 Tax=Culex pipiens TaxID=7175 RepID=A0A8D8B9M3_CULPI
MRRCYRFSSSGRGSIPITALLLLVPELLMLLQSSSLRDPPRVPNPLPVIRRNRNLTAYANCTEKKCPPRRPNVCSARIECARATTSSAHTPPLCTTDPSL